MTSSTYVMTLSQALLARSISHHGSSSTSYSLCNPHSTHFLRPQIHFIDTIIVVFEVIAQRNEFVKATIAYKNKVNSSTSVPQPLKLDVEMEMKRKKIVRSFSIARNIYSGGLGSGLQPIKEYELEAGAEFPDV
ncbi:protein NtpR-like [Prunus yedoensis var. nudiflora]|uniref:Protein NtpR-like n=1 Tax=Prunus yedoensis var. nudiflora TaxID=2094558 RepID=A0A314UFN8_PRUYE|nr:protein NtpR-like [Prunus yedoensis var. nudiflora]